MTDHLSPQKRSECMAKVHSTDTTPERKVRKIAFKLGYRYRLNVKNLPGKPDLVFPRLKKTIFVHGCFWHGHKCKHLPKTRKKFWREKLEQNRIRDKKVRRELKKLGWKPFVIWECWTKKNPKILELKIKAFLKKA